MRKIDNLIKGQHLLRYEQGMLPFTDKQMPIIGRTLMSLDIVTLWKFTTRVFSINPLSFKRIFYRLRDQDK